MKPFVIDLEIYPFEVLVVFENKKNRFFKRIKPYFSKKDIKELKGYNFSAGKCIMFPNGTSLIWMPKKPNCPRSFGTLSHEIFHYVSFVTDRIGLEYCMESQEAFAYLVGFITRKILEKIK